MADVSFSGDATVVDGSAVAASTGSADLIGGVFNDSIAAIGSGNGGIARLTSARALHTHPRDASGVALLTAAAAMGDATANPTVGGLGVFPAGYNGSTWDRLRSVLTGYLSIDVHSQGGVALAAAVALADATANPTVGGAAGYDYVFNGTTWDRQREATADGMAVTGIDAAGLMAYNGTTWDRIRSVVAANAATADTGILATGMGPGFARIIAQATLNGNGQTVVLNVKGAGTAFFDITATSPSLTGTWEVTTDDANWWAYSMLNVATGAWDATITAAGRWSSGEMARFRQVRLRISSYSSGSFTVNAHAEPMSRYVAIEGDNAAAVADQGNPVKIGGYASSALPSAVTAGQRANALFDLYGRQVVVLGKAGTGGSSAVGASASPVTVLAANAARIGATIANDSTAICYVLLGAGTVSTSLYTVAMPGNANGVAYYEAPYGFTGIITALWASATGNARVTEIT
jgi:hypothetical protein